MLASWRTEDKYGGFLRRLNALACPITVIGEMIEKTVARVLVVSCLAMPAFAQVYSPTPQVPPVAQPMTNAIPAAQAPAAAAIDMAQAQAIFQRVTASTEAASGQDAAAQQLYQAALQQTQVPLILRGLMNVLATYPASPVATETCLQVAKWAETDSQFGLAVPAYNAYLQRRPQAHDARRRLADAMRKMNRHDEAISQYQAVIQQDASPNSLMARDGLSSSLMAQKRYREAVDQIELLLRKIREVHGEDLRAYPNLPVLLLNEGLCLEELGQYQHAVKRYGELKRAVPASKEAELAQARLDDLSRPLFSSATYMPRPAASVTATPMAATPVQPPYAAQPTPGMSNQFENTAPAVPPAPSF